MNAAHGDFSGRRNHTGTSDFKAAPSCDVAQQSASLKQAPEINLEFGLWITNQRCRMCFEVKRYVLARHRFAA